MLILHNLVKFTLPTHELIQIYILYIRSVLETCAVVWNSSITRGEQLELERVQRTALKIILKENYSNYEDALIETNLKTLKDRRENLCRNFAKQCIKTGSSSDLFPLNPCPVNSRNHEKFKVTSAKTSRLAKSAVPYMQRLLKKAK